MKILSICNEKGGVGKTTTSYNVAYELARRKLGVLLVDLDKQCDLTKILNQHQGEVGIRQVLEGTNSIDEIYYENEDNLRFLLGSNDLRTYKDNNVNLRVLLEQAGIDKDIDFVIIDHPPEMNDATIKGFISSDYILIVTEVETLSINNVLPMMETLDIICSNHETSSNVIGIVANRVDNRRNLTKVNYEKLTEMLGDILFDTYIGTNTMIPYSIQEGKPVRKVGWSKAAKQYSLLTDEILERIKKYEYK